jgi:CRISPR system Cascade subunit CasE
MYLSQLVLDCRERTARHALANAYEMHRLLSRGYAYPRDGSQSAILFRVEQRGSGAPTVLVQTAQAPDWGLLPQGLLQAVAGPKPLDDLRFQLHQRLRFRLRANPTKRLRAGSPAIAGAAIDPRWIDRRVGLAREADQLAWLARKGQHHGFRILDVGIVPEGEVRFRKTVEGAVLTFLAVRFDGLLEVTAAESFLEILRVGVGPAKAFGFGLLSVGPG